MSEPFDPDAAAAPDAGPFGVDATAEEASLHVLTVPFDATSSYAKGAADGPAALLAASHQVELADLVAGEPWRRGIHLVPEDPRFEAWNKKATARADRVIAAGGRVAGDAKLQADLAAVNAISREVDAAVEELVGRALDAGKRVATLGGDHSVALGAIRAHAARHGELGLLHVDAHADLRPAFEGFERSHASVVGNALEACPGITRCVQVGVRDCGTEELARIGREGERLHAVFDHEWAAARAHGEDLAELVRRAVDTLPEAVYLTFDVDGLDPTLCPNTGTPVPGGLLWHEAWMWLAAVPNSGRRLVGCDLVEVAPGPAAAVKPGADPWDAVVGARLLYRMLACLAE